MLKLKHGRHCPTTAHEKNACGNSNVHILLYECLVEGKLCWEQSRVCLYIYSTLVVYQI